MTRRRIYLMAFFILLLTTVVGFRGASEAFAQELPAYVPGEILVKFKDVSSKATEERRTQKALEEKRVLQALGLRVNRHWPDLGVHRAQLEVETDMGEALRILRSRPDVEFAEPNYLRYKEEVVPNDPYYPLQWALKRIDMPRAWQVTTGSAEILLGVVDTGVNLSHQDLRYKIWKNPWEICGNWRDDDGDGYVDNCFGANVITGYGDPWDDDGHGTHVAGIAASVGNNALGIAGVDWRATILPIKFLGVGGGNVADFVEAVSFAKARGVRVMNLSYKGDFYSETEKRAIAGAPNILFVAAAGNQRYDNDIFPRYPASYDLPNLISVASTNFSERLASFSNYGVQTVHVAAPGEDIYGPIRGNSYGYKSGTSMSTPMVSGLATLILSKYPWASPASVKARILRTVDQNEELSTILTKGRVNAFKALMQRADGPYIYRLIFDSGPPGSSVTIRGSFFGASPGTVRFHPGVSAEILSWRDEAIVVRVPDDALSGNVVVQTAQGIPSNGVFFVVTPQLNTEWLSPIGWVSSFYVAYWGRCPDPEGLSYWVNTIESGILSAIQVAENFALSDEAKVFYAYFRSPSTAGDAERRTFVKEIYRHLFNREPDAEGLNYWTTLLSKGDTTPGQLIGHVINAAMTAHRIDWEVIRNKTVVGIYFADRVAQKGLVWTETLRAYAVMVLQGITADLNSAMEAIVLVDTLLG